MTHRIEKRAVRFDWEDVPLHWVPGDPFTTHVANVLHMLLPAGERWFCAVYVEAEPLVSDPRLAEDVRGFIEQEATHAQAHAVFLRALAAKGIDTDDYTRELRFLFGKLLGPAPLGIVALRDPMRREWLVFRVGAIAAIEQFTCVLGKWVLEAEALDEAGAHPTMLEMLRWHGAEEVEHRSVAFDLYEHLAGDGSKRFVHMAIVAPVMFALWIRGMRYLFARDPATPELARAPLRELVDRIERVSRETGRLPSLKALGRAALRYIEKDFHPRGEASLEVALEWLARSPAVAAGVARRAER
ncbi:metal-dependent hydrolase [Sandaracinus amylolyticus]|uniref:metal-dependent hydrolase n=1 Tax=Sandaracinus amylolyticus TaxID=927083 RepID=UPI001F2466A0|nr:metal-dependent hydrolase [Sandaracinus amylolyticus]UJR87001.1 Hypothetical protein I5071_91020 [Sandaracinus amylolyticus]